MATKRSVRQLIFFLAAMVVPAIASPSVLTNDTGDRAAALTGPIDWVRQTGDDKVVPQDACARFLLICGSEGATFKIRSAKGGGGVTRSFLWIGGRTALVTETRKRAIYFVLDSTGAVVRIAVVNLTDSKERRVANDDLGFGKLLALEIKFWQTQTPAGQ